MKPIWNVQRGGEVLENNPFGRGGMDIFWNYPMGNGRAKYEKIYCNMATQ